MNHRDTKPVLSFIEGAQRFDYLEILNICQRNQFRFQKLCFEHAFFINLLFSESLRQAQDRLSVSVVKSYK